MAGRLTDFPLPGRAAAPNNVPAGGLGLPRAGQEQTNAVAPFCGMETRVAQ